MKKLLSVLLLVGFLGALLFAAPSNVTAATDCSTGTYKVGSRGTCVEQIQKRLKELRYDPGTIDGIFGEKTKSAVIAFQKDKKLTQDGVVGPITWKALFGVVVEPPKPAKCPVSDLTVMTDPLALRMEKGETLIWDNVTKELLTAKSKFEAELKKKGWRVTYNSAYRPFEYQRHLYEIVTKLKDPKITDSACKTLKATLESEKSKHGLGTKVAAPSATAPHTKGIAFDATVYDAKGKAQNALEGWANKELDDMAKAAGLYRPHISDDGVHFQLR